MDDSINLVTAQITFLPLFCILFNLGYEEDATNIPWTDRHHFLNLSITPVGCSLMCSKPLIDKYLAPLIDQFNALLSNSTAKANGVEISTEEYVVVQVEGEGLDADQRVLELTGPLAMAGISIFFITTYFSDYILVPVKARHTVVTTLQQRGFVFSPQAEAYVSQLSPILHHHSPGGLQGRPRTSSSSDSDVSRPPSSSSPAPTTPPAKDIPELQIRTFTKLIKNGISPLVDPKLRLVNCAGNRNSSLAEAQELKEHLMQVLLAANFLSCKKSSKDCKHRVNHTTPGLLISDLDNNESHDISASFLSVTLSNEPISILMEDRLLPHFGSTLLASKSQEDVLVPITLDLRSLGWQATGIVGGVAGRLTQRTVSHELGEVSDDTDAIEISFLSSAKAGSVIVHATQLERALKALKIGMEEVQARN
ncbi:hypothetical protein LTS08_008090 [Lithohypha guttulata]|uniref:CASTOR ACT domain-containing protein n=1 Tax=Lithohypha guttulata TaxID=1690604 RepID=A0AAN7Y7G0_9EURO|nr:hypothetical protein LTR51_005059 [Lithohypha guttulata]KAK5087808.1 hypothetical protein LTR05_002023 [Lithohypha guttulata]KAK5095448.1 hypothetical protein LTS08_008090 [Lithohypha guttulata]